MKSLKTKLEAPLCSKSNDCDKRPHCDGRGTMYIGIFNDLPVGCWEYRRMHERKEYEGKDGNKEWKKIE